MTRDLTKGSSLSMNASFPHYYIRPLDGGILLHMSTVNSFYILFTSSRVQANVKHHIDFCDLFSSH